ncbi:hypothetical protein KMT30_12515 [Streptomyces sp. IBSBF 2953]|nr:hypothetical protein [Streptomyces hayashii]
MDASSGALIAGSAAVMASAVTGWFASRTAQAQARLHLDTQRAGLDHERAEARHQHRRQVYAEFIKSVGLLHSKLGDMTAIVGSPSEFEEALREARVLRAQLLSTTHEAYLEGPSSVGAGVRNAWDGINEYWKAVRLFHQALTGGDSAIIQDCRERMNERRAETRRLRDLFVEAAQAVLEAE